MAQVDMKRFYIGCGESLQVHPSNLGLAFDAQSQQKRSQLSRLIARTIATKKQNREESR
jgi:hypothetical protein